MGRAILLADAANPALVAELKNTLALEPVAIEPSSGAIPDVWESVVVLFLLTNESLLNTGLTSFAEEAAAKDLPVVPVVESIAGFSFRSIPDTLRGIKSRNAIEFLSDGGERLRIAVRGYLGLSSFAHDRKVFVSYRRSDGDSAARAIHADLLARGFQAFLDVFSLEGGDVVQERITEELLDKDFVLLIDSPEAASSEWVMAEIAEALNQRIPVCAVSLGGAVFSLLGAQPRVPWDPGSPYNLQRVFLLVSRGIAERSSFDSRVQRTVRGFAGSRSVAVARDGHRRLFLRRGTTELLVEFENAAVTLERAHRLSISHKACPGDCEGILICGDRALPPATRAAAAWAFGGEPLQVLSLPDLAGAIARRFP